MAKSRRSSKANVEPSTGASSTGASSTGASSTGASSTGASSTGASSTGLNGDDVTRVRRHHLMLGWLALSGFMALGIALETLHGLKLDLYLDVRHSTRRMLWTLAHAHGTLFSLIHIAYAFTLSQYSRAPSRMRFVSACLTAGLILVPGGFFLGGVSLHGGDPNLGILLVPAGAFAMLFGVGWTAVSVFRSQFTKNS